MSIQITSYKQQDIEKAIKIWNEIVAEGVAFPQTEPLTQESGDAFFSAQSYTGIARDDASGEMLGLYILHPNNVGRCGHICNASYAVSAGARGRGVGEALVRDCMRQAKVLGFRILQFNAVVKTNASALHLYQKLGFTQLGVIPGGFRLDDGTYEDIIPHYIVL
ncbi:MAG: GNAT family N-acetyltransferase [Christensenella sp.]|nr:GNAT family N-acetyltransferase [Christensenella sp.]